MTKLVEDQRANPIDYAGFAIAQIKEKFGGARCYFETQEDTSDEFFNRINILIGEAERKAWQTCEDCGKPAKLRTLGYIRTLCSFPHAEGDDNGV